jgi:Mrp family chromosome partitioning ATPase/capsular polysaccharide biosynthesis protein
MDALEVSPLQPTIFGAIVRHIGLVVACVVGFAGLGFAYGLGASADASAVASIVVADPNGSGVFRETPDPRYPANQASIIRLPSTAEEAVKLVNTRIPAARLSADDLRAGLTVTLDTDSDLIRVKFRNSRPEVAAAGANAVVDAYQTAAVNRARQLNASALQQIDGAIQTLDERIRTTRNTDPTSADFQTRAELQSRRLELVVNAAVAGTGVVASSPATRPGSPSRSGALRYALLGGIAGLLLGAGLSYLVAGRRRRIGSRRDPELLLERPFLAEIPDFGRERLPSDLPAFDGEDSAAAEGFRFAADALESGRSYAVISAVAGEGRSVVAANIAVTAARGGRRVLAVDGSREGRGLAWLLGTPTDRPGLAQVGREEIDADGACRRVDQVPGELFVLPPGTGPEGRAEPLDPTASARALEAVKQGYDLVILDAPPLLERAAGAALARGVDSVLVVVPHGADVRTLEEFAQRVRLLRLPVLGYLYTRAPGRRRRGLWRLARRPELTARPGRSETAVGSRA